VSAPDPVPADANDPNTPQRGAADPTASVWVSASAGTGKTKILTDRVLNLMLAGTPPHRILCLTYTKAAAAEMRTRIAGRLIGWATADEDALARQLFDLLGQEADADHCRLARQLLARVLDAPGGLKIGTIHAFCQSLLARFPLEAGIAPHFAVLDERDARDLLSQARDRMLAAAGRAGAPLAAALAEVTRHSPEKSFSEMMATLASARHRIAALLARYDTADGASAAVRARHGLSPGDTAAGIAAAACADAALDAAGLHQAAGALAQGTPTDQKRAGAIRSWLDLPADRRLEAFDTYAEQFLTGEGAPRRTLITRQALATMPGAEAILRAEAERLNDVRLRLRAAVTAQATTALLHVGSAILEQYGRLKHARSLLDYDDLIGCAGTLLAEEGQASWVLYKLDGGIDHVLIDEAQDTSPAQWALISALTAEFFAGAGARQAQRTLFAVGDVKQSIFSFQGARPDAFVTHREHFGERARSAGEFWRPVTLNVSFRSTRAVLAAVDAVFARDEAAAGVALDGQPIVHRAFRQQDGGRVEIWPPLQPRPSDEPIPWQPPTTYVSGDLPQTRLARLIARRIERMIGSGERLVSQARPIRPGDIMVLVRRRSPFVEDLVRTLKAMDVPVAGVDRMLLIEQLAVMDLVAIGQFALLPGDDLTLATVLKGPMIGLDEDALFRLAYRREGSLWQALGVHARDDAVFADAYRRLADILATTDVMPPFEFFSRLLGPLGGRRQILARIGHEAEDPIAEFLELALAYERTHAPSLQGFLHWLQTTAVEVKRDLQQGDFDAVRVMTVHGAKGLEAPIVFLPDTLQGPKHEPGLLWTAGENGDPDLMLWAPLKRFRDPIADTEIDRQRDREMREYRRLLYVAMTRAGDRLIVCGWHTNRPAPKDCWYNLIRDGLQAKADDPALVTIDDPFLAGVPEFDGRPEVLCLSYPQQGPVTAPATPPEEPPPPLPAWAETSAPPEPPAARPIAPSRLGRDHARAQPLAGSGARVQRGRLIHRLLQSLPQLPPADWSRMAATWLARPAHRLDAAQQAEIAAEVMQVMTDPASARLFGPGSLAEVPFSGNVAGRAISGRIDRLLVTAEGVTLLDYKTDREPPRTAAKVPSGYLQQMAAYRSVIRSIYPGRGVRCLLVWTDGPHVMHLGDDLLDRYMP
jgi:ATP-dependent helicase/nuclease subunit A